MHGTQVQSLGQEDLLEKEIATHFKREGTYIYLWLIYCCIVETNKILLNNYTPIKNKFEKTSFKKKYHLR